MKNRNIGIYDPFVTGHHVEYIFHLLRYNEIKNETGLKLTLIVSKAFIDTSKGLIQESLLNEVEFIFIEDYLKPDEIEQNLDFYNNQIKILNTIAKAKVLDKIVFMFLDNPLQIALTKKNAKNLNAGISGILINPFAGYGKGLWKLYYRFRKMLQNFLLVYFTKLKYIYIITNEETANHLNRIFFTNKFRYVSDPVLGLKGPGEDKTTSRETFLVFGSLSKRKGVMTVLKALEGLPENKLKNIQVKFVGSVSKEIRKTFFDKVELIKRKDPNSIQVDNRFVPYNEIPMNFSNTDYVLLPYEETQASSGVVGHAAFYKKPIIACGQGLLKEHIETYKLGVIFSELKVEILSDLFIEISDKNLKIEVNEERVEKYLEFRNWKLFAQRVLNNR